ncbi:MAG: hypothetical protein COA78_13310 [Blastopirellula sp.]|nr:MAG: hypothetical protein COA78_13310 [Blastopirellula sp.]
MKPRSLVILPMFVLLSSLCNADSPEKAKRPRDINVQANSAGTILNYSSQAEIINQKIASYHEAQYKSDPKVLRVIYFHAKNQSPCKNYQQRWDGIIKDIKKFFDAEMARNGYPSQKFNIEIDQENNAILHLVQGKLEEADYGYRSGSQIRKEIKEALRKKSIDIENETILVICGLSKTKGDKVDIDSPFYGIGANQTRGTCFAMDSDWLEIPGLLNKAKRVQVREDHHPGDHYKQMSMSQFNVTYIGGTIHELGHGLSLPHNKATKTSQQKYGTALMGSGNYTYRKERITKGQKGSFLTHAHAVRLATHPLFSGSRRDVNVRGNAELHEMVFTNQDGKIEVRGTVVSDLPTAAVVAYHDPDGGGDYNARNWTTVLDEKGHFNLEIDGPVKGKHQIRIVICHLNGATTQYRIDYTCDESGVPMLDQLPSSYKPRSRR